MAKTKIICLCGSSKFVGESAVKAWEFNKQGIATFFMPLLPHWYQGVREHHQAEAEGVAANLDALWLQLIAMADEVFVINCGGYIGERTGVEIRHAQASGKLVNYLEPTQERHQCCHGLLFEEKCFQCEVIMLAESAKTRGRR